MQMNDIYIYVRGACGVYSYFESVLFLVCVCISGFEFNCMNFFPFSLPLSEWHLFVGCSLNPRLIINKQWKIHAYVKYRFSFDGFNNILEIMIIISPRNNGTKVANVFIFDFLLFLNKKRAFCCCCRICFSLYLMKYIIWYWIDTLVCLTILNIKRYRYHKIKS